MSSIDRSEVFVEFEIVRTGLSGTMPKGNPTAVPALTRNQLIAELKQLESSLEELRLTSAAIDGSIQGQLAEARKIIGKTHRKLEYH